MSMYRLSLINNIHNNTKKRLCYDVIKRLIILNMDIVTLYTNCNYAYLPVFFILPIRNKRLKNISLDLKTKLFKSKVQMALTIKFIFDRLIQEKFYFELFLGWLE